MKVNKLGVRVNEFELRIDKFLMKLYKFGMYREIMPTLRKLGYVTW